MGTGEPLVLLHGVMGSERMWQDVAPLLASEYEVIAPTAVGHRGGETLSKRPARYRDVIAGAERQLDRLSLARAHLVGNSMGGWMALDLARRGRARSVYAISPAGMWPAPAPGGKRPRSAKLIRALKMGRATRAAMPLLYRSRSLRQLAFRDVIAHGERLTPEFALALSDDMLGSEIAEDLLETDEYLAPLDPAPCPITIAWAEWDRIFPERVFGPLAKERVPGARYTVLAGVGHVPMLEDPELVADAIRAWLRAPRGAAPVSDAPAMPATRSATQTGASAAHG
jgi:pimeloyl-ACP methyl ester carboxylesterase